MNDLVSIIIPITRENFIVEVLLSIQAQTYKNYEILIINDRPESQNLDNYLLSLLNNFNFKYLKNEKNIGLSATRNKGIQESKGEYIQFLDDDTKFIDSNALKNMVQLIKKEQTDLVLSKNLIIKSNKNSIRFVNTNNFLKQIVTDVDKIKYTDFLEDYNLYEAQIVQQKLYRKSLFINNNIKFKEGYYSEEDDLAFNILPYIEDLYVSLYAKKTVEEIYHNFPRITMSIKYKKDKDFIHKEIINNIKKSNLSKNAINNIIRFVSR